MPAIPAIIAIATVTAAVGGIIEGAIGLSESSKTPSTPAAPSTATAQQTATEAQTAQRRSVLAAGGGTNVTGGSGIILGSDISSVSLVGSS